MATTTSPRWVTTEAAAVLMSTSPEMVRRMLRRGELAGMKLGRSWRVDLWAIGKEAEYGRLDGDAARDGRDDAVRHPGGALGRRGEKGAPRA